MSISEQPESTPTTASGTIAARDGELHAAFADTAISGDERAAASSETLLDDPRSGERPGPARDSGDGFVSGGHRRAVFATGRVDNYRIIGELGSGGMAVVYRAEDTRLQRHVALKILHDHIANRPENRERFEREARAVARLKHPNIMSVYGFSTPSAPVGYIAAELIDGETLREFVERRAFGFPEIGAMVCLKLAEALLHAHESGIIHRDFKPENVMITRDGVPKLMDFGLARLLDHQTMTMTGAVLGSPAHMSPEAIEGKPVDRRVDIFAFGTVLYFATTSRLPFDGRNPAVILNAILGGRYAEPTLANPKIGARLSRIITRCMETDPDDRFESVAELVNELRSHLSALGLTDVQGELATFFADPDGYEAAFGERLTTALVAQADAALSNNRMAAALALCDQILAIEPEHPAALRLLGQANTRVKARRGLAALAVTGAVAAGLYAVAAGQPEPDAVVPPPEPLAVLVDGEGSGESADVSESDGSADAAVVDPAEVLAEAIGRAAGGVEASRAAALGRVRADATRTRAESVAFTRGRAIAARDVQVRRPPRLPAAVRAVAEGSGDALEEVIAAVVDSEPVPVTFRLQPPTAAVRIDGVDQGLAYQVQSRRLTPGQHRISMHIPNTRDARLVETFEVIPGALNEFSFTVEFADGYLVFDGTREGHVVVNGRVYAVNEEVAVSIPGGTEGSSVAVDVEYHPPVGAPRSYTVRVQTEGTTRLDLGS